MRIGSNHAGRTLTLQAAFASRYAYVQAPALRCVLRGLPLFKPCASVDYLRMKKKPHVELFADGACSGNPGPGGYGTILKMGEHTKEFSGGYNNTTNNRMEILGVIIGLEGLKQPCRVRIVSDSQYVVNSISKGWVFSWQKNNWKKADKKRAENVDLWERLLPLLELHECEFEWIRGHNGHPENERCDELAVTAYKAGNLPKDPGYEGRGAPR